MKGVTVSQFYDQLSERLQLKLVAGEEGLRRRILLSEINRPGLILSGYSRYFARRRGQVMGKVEISYLRELDSATRRERLQELFSQKIPFCIVARNYVPPREMLEEANSHGVPVFRSPQVTIRLVNACTIYLQERIAPQTTVFGNLAEVYGVGVLIMGKSGAGKSECTLSLVERGHRLVCDDIVHIRLIEGEYLMGEGSELTRFHMEIRGLGIINIKSLFGPGSVRQRNRLDLAVTLEHWDPEKEYERLGLDESHYTLLGVSIPHLLVPVRPGRDLALLVELAALNFRSKQMGHNPAQELDQLLMGRLGRISEGS